MAAAFTMSSARAAIPTPIVLLSGVEYHHCCHSNLTRALAAVMQGCRSREAERHVHDVLNVFMCTGFTRDTHQYFMKASPVRPGDFIEFFAEIDLLGALSACPGGDCGASHSSDARECYPLKVEIYRPRDGALQGWQPPERSATRAVTACKGAPGGWGGRESRPARRREPWGEVHAWRRRESCADLDPIAVDELDGGIEDHAVAGLDAVAHLDLGAAVAGDRDLAQARHAILDDRHLHAVAVEDDRAGRTP